MPNHQIEFLSRIGMTYTVMIDGQKVELSLNGNKIKYGDVDDLSNYIDALGEGVVSGDFGELVQQVNGTNMLALLYAIYKDELVLLWETFYKSHGVNSFYRSFLALFGFAAHSSKTTDEAIALLQSVSDRVKENSSWTDHVTNSRLERADQFALESPHSFVAENNEWHVYRVPGNENNVISFKINGKEVDLCVAHKKENGDPHRLLSVLVEIQAALKSFDDVKLLESINTIGAAAALRILNLFFRNETIAFFNRQLELSVTTRRIPPCPNAILKYYFQGSAAKDQSIAPDIMDSLEAMIPNLEQFLIDSSLDELHSDCKAWKLFYRKNGNLLSNTITFFESDNLSKELQAYYRFLAEIHINSKKNYASSLVRNHTGIQMILSRMEPLPNSVFEFNFWSMCSALSFLREEGATSLSSERRALFALREFIAFYDVNLSRRVIPDTLIPPRIINPTQPISHNVVEQIRKHKAELPRVVYLAFEVFIQTGARLDSICSMQVGQLTHQSNRWLLTVYYSKTESRDAKAGRPSFRIHELKNGLGPELNSFIQETATLRLRLSTPYIFIYQSSQYRDETKRAPKTLTSNAFVGFFNALCTKNGIPDDDGMLAKCTAKMIRAEVGRGMLASGKSTKATAEKLGNSEIVVAMHYNKRYPLDEAAMHRAFYAKTLDDKIGCELTLSDPTVRPNSPMYGSCHNSAACQNHNDCRTCSLAIKCKSNNEEGAFGNAKT